MTRTNRALRLMLDQCAAIAGFLNLERERESIDEVIQRLLIADFNSSVGFRPIEIARFRNHPRFFVEFFEALLPEKFELLAARIDDVDHRTAIFSALPIAGRLQEG